MSAVDKVYAALIGSLRLILPLVNDQTGIDIQRRGYNRLGFALQLSTVRFLGTFLANPLDVPLGVVNFVAGQLAVKGSASLDKYMERKQTRYAHCIEIQQQ